MGIQGGADVYLERHGGAYLSVCASYWSRLCFDGRYPTLYYGRLPEKAETWKSNFKPTTVERFELG